MLGTILFIGATGYLSKVVYEYFLGDTVDTFYVEQFLAPIIPISIGAYMIINSLKIGLNIKVTLRNKSRTLSIEELRKNEKLSDFICYLSGNQLTKGKLKLKDEKVRVLATNLSATRTA